MVGSDGKHAKYKYRVDLKTWTTSRLAFREVKKFYIIRMGGCSQKVANQRLGYSAESRLILFGKNAESTRGHWPTCIVGIVGGSRQQVAETKKDAETFEGGLTKTVVQF